MLTIYLRDVRYSRITCSSHILRIDSLLLHKNLTLEFHLARPSKILMQTLSSVSINAYVSWSVLIHQLPTKIFMRCALRGHRKAISTLSITSDGRTLLSGGQLEFYWSLGRQSHCNPDEDGQIALWNINTGTKLQDIACSIHGAIITSVWITNSQGNVSAFTFGCADGSIQVFRHPDHNMSDLCISNIH